jgi:hypothetical protein
MRGLGGWRVRREGGDGEFRSVGSWKKRRMFWLVPILVEY